MNASRPPGRNAHPQPAEPQRRVRRRPEQARRQILDAAEALLIGGGPHAVTIRSVAGRVGMTDMGVNHHYGSRQRLLEALLDDVSSRLRQRITALAHTWVDDEVRLGPLVDLLADGYTAGHVQLAVELHAAGWRDRRSPILGPVVSALHLAREQRLRRPADVEETRYAVAAMHQALALEPAFGSEFRRSVGIGARTSKDSKPVRDFWLATMSRLLGIPP